MINAALVLIFGTDAAYGSSYNPCRTVGVEESRETPLAVAATTLKPICGVTKRSNDSYLPQCIRSQMAQSGPAELVC